MTRIHSLQALLLAAAFAALPAPATDTASAGPPAPTPSASVIDTPDSELNRELNRKLQEELDRAGVPAAGSPSRPPPVDARSTAAAVLQIVVSLAFLLLIAVGALVLWQRLHRGTGRAQAGGTIDLLEARPVGPGRHVHLVRIHDRVVAFATSGQGLALLAEFQGTDAARIIAESGAGSAPVRDFSESLDRLMERFRSRGAGGGPGASSTGRDGGDA